MVNSRHPLVCAPSSRLPGTRALFSRSYEGNLPSSFNTVLSSASVCSTSPPVSVSGTVYTLELFPGTIQLHGQSDKPTQHFTFVTSSRLGNIDPIPIGYGFRPRLRGPAHPARINLAQEPLDFRRQSFSLCLSLLMSAFSLPIPPARLTPHLRRLTERSATTQMPEDRYQGSGIRGQMSGIRGQKKLIPVH